MEVQAGERYSPHKNLSDLDLIFNSDIDSNLDFFENLGNLFEQLQRHTVFIRYVYFINYNKLKAVF